MTHRHTGSVYFIAYADINYSSCIQQGTKLPQTHCMFFVELRSCAWWTQVAPTQMSNLSKLQGGQDMHQKIWRGQEVPGEGTVEVHVRTWS